MDRYEIGFALWVVAIFVLGLSFDMSGGCQ